VVVEPPPGTIKPVRWSSRVCVPLSPAIGPWLFQCNTFHNHAFPFCRVVVERSGGRLFLPNRSSDHANHRRMQRNGRKLFGESGTDRATQLTSSPGALRRYHYSVGGGQVQFILPGVHPESAALLVFINGDFLVENNKWVHVDDLQ
jgi:hypothetical protein